MKKNTVVGCWILVCAGVSWSAPAKQLASIRGTEVFLSDADANHIAQVTKDGTKKAQLRWAPSGRQLSYLIRDGKGAKARLIVVDLSGTRLNDIAVRPVTDPPTMGLHFIEEVSWASASTLRFSGSVNPENCETFDLDIRTGKESNWDIGRCGSLTVSPDGRHTAGLGAVGMGLLEDRVDSVELDGKLIYAGNDDQIYVTAGPVWSGDSHSVAFVEKRRQSGQFACTIISLAGAINSIPLAGEFSDSTLIRWVGAQVVISDGDRSMMVDQPSKHLGLVTSEVSDKLQKTTDMEERARRMQEGAQALIQRLDAQEGVLSPTSHLQ